MIRTFVCVLAMLALALFSGCAMGPFTKPRGYRHAVESRSRFSSI